MAPQRSCLETSLKPHFQGILFALRSLRMYNSLVEKCFKDCVESFRRKDLESSEEKVGVPGRGCCLHGRRLVPVPPPSSCNIETLHAPRSSCILCSPTRRLCISPLLHDIGCFAHLQCVQRCCDKFMKHSSRVGVRFAELSAQAEQQVQSMVGQ